MVISRKGFSSIQTSFELGKKWFELRLIFSVDMPRRHSAFEHSSIRRPNAARGIRTYLLLGGSVMNKIEPFLPCNRVLSNVHPALNERKWELIRQCIKELAYSDARSISLVEVPINASYCKTAHFSRQFCPAESGPFLFIHQISHTFRTQFAARREGQPTRNLRSW